MQHEFRFMPKGEIQLPLGFLKKADELSAEDWHKRQAEDRAENQRNYRR